MPNYYFSGQGTVYSAERTALGQPKGLRPLGNVPSLEISIDVTKFEHTESETGGRVQDIDLVQEKNGTIAFTLESITAENLAIAFWGTKSVQAAATALVDNDIIVYLDAKSKFTTHVNLDPGTLAVVKDVPDLITYEFGSSPTDVLSLNGWIDYPNGSIFLFSTALQTSNGAAAVIADATQLHITVFDTLGYSKAIAFTQTSQERYLRFEGLNTLDNEEVIINVFKASLDPLQGYGVINEEIATMEMNGAILLDSLQIGNNQFFEQFNNAAAGA